MSNAMSLIYKAPITAGLLTQIKMSSSKSLLFFFASFKITFFVIDQSADIRVLSLHLNDFLISFLQ